MSAGEPPFEPPSLFGITLRRSTLLGRYFLVYGTVMSTLLGVALAFSAGATFVSAYPIILPVFGSVGSLGGLTVFTSDRMKGTLEYFLAYGVSPRRLFGDVLLSALVAVTIVLAIAVGSALGVYAARGYPLTGDLLLGLGVYAIPMAYASAALGTTAGMYWSALSSPRASLSSPIGLSPFIGILPPVTVLFAIAAIGIAGDLTTASADAVTLAGVGVVVLLVVILVSLSGRLLRRERLLSTT